MLQTCSLLTSHKSLEKLKMLGFRHWPYFCLLLLAALSASVQTGSLPGQRLQKLLSQLLLQDPESMLAEDDVREGSSFGPQLLPSAPPFLPSGANTFWLSLWRQTLAKRKWTLSGERAWKTNPRGCFGLKLDRIGTFSGLGC